MKFDEVFEITEARGESSFDYKFWFWAKRDSAYGFGYARQDITFDVSKKSKEIVDAAEEIKTDLADSKGEEEEDFDLEVVEKRIKANTKRITGVFDLFNSPIVIFWMNNDPPNPISIPTSVDDDVTDSNGRRINVVKLFQDPGSNEFVTKVMNWNKVKIREDLDSLNSIYAKLIKFLFSGDAPEKKVRALARNEGIENIMKNLHFKNDDVEVVAFKESDYDLLPKEFLGSKKIVSKIKDIMKEQFQDLLKKARSSFK